MNTIERLEEFAKKYYRFEIKFSGGIQPGDGYNISLFNYKTGHSISIYGDLDCYKDKSLEELINIALDKWGEFNEHLDNFRLASFP